MSSGPKIRLDQCLVNLKLAPTRSRAQDLIKSGLVAVDGEVVTKTGTKVSEIQTIEISADAPQWVSRGALKLLKAIEVFDLSIEGSVCVDVGASTGGFSEVLLAHGAQKVYSVDVGHDQLAAKLRDNPHIINLEGVNARHLNDEYLPEPLDLLVCDASFISLKLVLPEAMARVKAGGAMTVLIKPQFEVGKGRVGKGGIVRDPILHDEVCSDLQNWVNHQEGWRVEGLCESPITGPDGNVEFLLYALKHQAMDNLAQDERDQAPQ